MAHSRLPEVALRAWAPGDLALLERLMGDPHMTEHLGGPETPEKIQRRHERYLALDGPGQMFVITVGPNREAAGSVGYWELVWQDETSWETGWNVLPEFQGQGVATRATALAVARAGADGRYRRIHAFPAVENAPSNAVCRKVGFSLIGECEVEYPAGRMMRANDWVLDLAGAAGQPSATSRTPASAAATMNP